MKQKVRLSDVSRHANEERFWIKGNNSYEWPDKTITSIFLLTVRKEENVSKIAGSVDSRACAYGIIDLSEKCCTTLSRTWKELISVTSLGITALCPSSQPSSYRHIGHALVGKIVTWRFLSGLPTMPARLMFLAE